MLYRHVALTKCLASITCRVGGFSTVYSGSGGQDSPMRCTKLSTVHLALSTVHLAVDPQSILLNCQVAGIGLSIDLTVIDAI
jgi:hypothetical protein